MLDLDSTRWSELSHAYGPATDTPALLGRIYTSPREADWSDLYGSVAHQGTIYTAAYAVAPVAPHVVNAAETVGNADRLDYLSFVGFVVAGYDKPPVPDDLCNDYERSVERARDLALELLPEIPTYTAAVYALQAVCALSNRIALARVIEGLADHEFQLDCPQCSAHLYVETEEDDFVTYAEDPIRSPTTKGHVVVTPQELSMPRSSESADLYPGDLQWVIARQPPESERDEGRRRHARRCRKCLGKYRCSAAQFEEVYDLVSSRYVRLGADRSEERAQ